MKNIFSKIALCTFLAISLSTSFLQANDSGRHDSGRRCRFCRKVQSLERNLGIIRGNTAATIVQPTSGGPLTGITVVPTSGKGFTITNSTISESPNVAALLGGAAAASVKIFVITSDVSFNCPFRDIPTVVVNLLGNTSSSPIAVFGGSSYFISNLSTTGFRLVELLTIYGINEAAVNDYAALSLANTGYDFIATGVVKK